VDHSHRSRARAPRRVAPLAAIALLAASLTPVSAASSVGHGPSTTTDPYVLPVADGVHLTSLLTVNDAGAAGDGYEMVGIPDGIGVTAEGNSLVALMNHELRDTRASSGAMASAAPSWRGSRSIRARWRSRAAPT